MTESSHGIESEHLRMLLYFALKKTGDRLQAEELAQEIAYEAVVSLSRGSLPADFESWLWGVARRRYARWVTSRQRTAGHHLQAWSDYDVYLLPDQGHGPENEVVLREQLHLLRRELALLSKDHREIVVSYYVDGRRLSDIASAVGLPEGTVKRKLFESRKNLKEGMSMARADGQRSYAPEDVSFTTSGTFTTEGTPWPLITRAIPKNILLEAYNNPSTLEDLSLSLGVAAPYMEEEVGLLTDSTLLKRLDDGRYETDFIILDKETQLANFADMVHVSENLCPLIIDRLDDALAEIRSIGFARSDLPAEELYWLLLPMVADYIRERVEANRAIPQSYTSRPHDAQWEIMGYETCDLPFSTIVGYNGCGATGAMFRSYKIQIEGLWDRAGELKSPQVALLADIFRNRRGVSSLSSPEREIINEVVLRGFVTVGGDIAMPTFPVFDETHKGERKRLQTILEREFIGAPLDMVNSLFDDHMQRIGHSVPARLNRQVLYAVSDLLSRLRMMVLRYALENGRIAMPVDPGRSTIAMDMEV